MDSAEIMAAQIVSDVLLSRSTTPADGQAFRMATVEPGHWPAERVALAKRYAARVPATATHADVPRLAATIAPDLRRGLQGVRNEYF
jgi:hypothetical protein